MKPPVTHRCRKAVLYLEGIWLDERIVAIYSDKGYANKWKELSNNEPQLKMGVNFVVFALDPGGWYCSTENGLFLCCSIE